MTREQIERQIEREIQASLVNPYGRDCPREPYAWTFLRSYSPESGRLRRNITALRAKMPAVCHGCGQTFQRRGRQTRCADCRG